MLELENGVRSTPRPPRHVTARTEAVELGDLHDYLPESYVHRQETQPHESPWHMTVPLLILAGLAAVAGGLNLPFTKDLHFLEHWLEPSLFGHEAKVAAGAGTKWALAVIAIAGGLIAIIGAFRVYRRGAVDPAQIEIDTLSNAWYVDATYADFFGGPGRRLFDLMSWFDRTVVDGAVGMVAKGADATGAHAAGDATRLRQKLCPRDRPRLGPGDGLVPRKALLMGSFLPGSDTSDVSAPRPKLGAPGAVPAHGRLF